MKPIIIDMKDMSDSTEVYQSKPNRFLVYTIYLILVILVAIVLWMSLSKMDIVVKSNGIFKGSNAVYEISSSVTGSVKETFIENGQYVVEGDVLYVLNIEELSDTILRYQDELESSKDRLEILAAYEKSLDGDQDELEACADNPYYEEFVNRRELLYANVNISESDTDGQLTLYQGNVNSLTEETAKYNEKIGKLNAVKQCITVRNNTFDAGESSYYSMVNSYLASYNYTALQYDNQIKEYQRQIDGYDEQIKKLEGATLKKEESVKDAEDVGGADIQDKTNSDAIQNPNAGDGEGEFPEEEGAVTDDENVGGNDIQNETDSDVMQKPNAGDGESEFLGEEGVVTDDENIGGNDVQNEPNSDTMQNQNTVDVEALKKQREALVATCDLIKKEKAQSLMNLELQQIATIEQQIAGYNDTILSLKSNLTSAELQLNAINDVDNEAKETIAVRTEKGNIAAEILSYEEKQKECEAYLKNYDIQNNNCIIKANSSGYFYTSQELKVGRFVQEGATIGSIYPETESKYYAEIYVENTDIAQIKEEQKVKFEIAAYPSSEYGYFEGIIENIARDISVDQSTGYAYYLVRVKCDNMILKGKDGKEATLMNGMACQAKIVVDEKTVLTYFLEKIDLLD